MEINLISADQKRQSFQRRTVWMASVAAGILLILSGLAAAAVYSLRLVNTKQITKQETLVTQLQQKLVELAKVEQRQALIHDRLNSLNQMVASRPDIKQKLDKLIGTFPTGVTIESLKIDDGRVSEVSIQSATFLGFFDTLKILEGGGFSSVNFEGVSRDKKGTYQAKILIAI